MPTTRKNAKSVNTGDDITTRVDRLSAHFQSEMDRFRKELTTVSQSGVTTEPADVSTADELLLKFNEFQRNMEADMQALRAQVESLSTAISETAQYMDRSLQQSYRNRLLVYGIPETDGERTEVLMNKVVDVVNERMRSKHIEIGMEDIDDCYRYGKKRADKPRAICIDFVRIFRRNLVYNNKSAFKGSKVLVAEYLTKTRFGLFKEAKRRFNRDCWTLNGEVFICVGGVKRLVRKLKDLD